MLHTTKPADYISAERLTEPSNCPDCGANSVMSVGVIHLGHYLYNGQVRQDSSGHALIGASCHGNRRTSWEIVNRRSRTQVGNQGKFDSAQQREHDIFAGSVVTAGTRAAANYTLIDAAKLNDVDPQAWLADVLARLQKHPARRIAELLPWNWKLRQHRAAT